MVDFFETTWFLWWLVAMIVIGCWCWITFFEDQPGNKNNSKTWKELYRWRYTRPTQVGWNRLSTKRKKPSCSR